MFQTINGGKLPTRGSKFSAYVDVYSNKDITIGTGETVMIPLGISVSKDDIYKMLQVNGYFTGEHRTTDVLERFMSEHYLQLALRSSLGKKGLILPNGIGIIDLDYLDKEIQMIIHNPVTLKSIVKYLLSFGRNKSKWHLKTGWRIGQITLLEHKSKLFGIESDVVRDGGFGSSGV